jgi:hypothetical protein
VQYQLKARDGPWGNLRLTDRYVLDPAQRRGVTTVDVDVAFSTPPSRSPLAWRVRVLGAPPQHRVSRWFYHNFNLTGQGTIKQGIPPEVEPPPEPPPPTAPTYPYRLDVPYPNPFNPDVTVRFFLDRAAFVRLSVYDVAGRRVALLTEGLKASGPHRIRWDGRSDGGGRVASGVYFVRLASDAGVASRKLVVAR